MHKKARSKRAEEENLRRRNTKRNPNANSRHNTSSNPNANSRHNTSSSPNANSRHNTSSNPNANSRHNTSSSHSAPNRRNVSSHSAHSKHNGPQGSSHRPLLTTVAAAIMAAFLTLITVPISVTSTRSTWGVHG